MARLALQSIPGEKVDEALRQALAELQGDLKAGVIQTLGDRRDRLAVPLLAPLAGDPDRRGRCGPVRWGKSAEPTRCARSKRPGCPRAETLRFHAILRCAERLAAEGQPAGLLPCTMAIYEQTHDLVIQTAALRGS